MARVKRGPAAQKRRRRLLAYTKGFRYGRKTKYRLAKEALLHAWVHAFNDRRRKKREKHQLWQVKINAACRQEGLNYSKFMGQLKKKEIRLDRKILALLAEKHPLIWKEVTKKAKE